MCFCYYRTGNILITTLRFVRYNLQLISKTAFMTDSLYLGKIQMNITIKGAPSGLRKNLVTESPLKIIKNAFSSTLEALFFLKLFKFLYARLRAIEIN